MADLIILRLHPSDPMAPADFTNLISGLTITAFDLTFDDSVTGVQLGAASGLANPHLSSTTTNQVAIGSTSILQHYIDVTDLNGTTRHLESVATAVIVADPPAGHREYPTPTSYDLRLEIANAAGATIADDHLDFNVTVTTVGSLSTSQKVYFGLAASAYVELPATGGALDPNIAFVELPDDGQPPPFDQLVHAIDLVLAGDPGSPHDSLVAAAPLTPAQSKQLAAEIVWNRSVYPAPQPDPTLGLDPFGALYTNPSVDPSVSGDDIEKARPKFEADQDSYYGTREADTLRMAGYVYSAGAAIVEEQLSIAAQQAVIEVPLITGAATPTSIPSAAIAVTSSGGGLVPEFVVPAAAFYALAATMPTQVDAAHRYDTARLTLEAKLLSDLNVAVDARLLTFPATPSTQPGPALSVDQMSRRLSALGGTQTELVAVSLAAPIDALVGDWLNYSGTTDAIDTSFWEPEVLARPDAYLELVLDAVTGDYQPLIDAITGAPYAVTTVAQLVALTDTQWRALYLDALPPLATPPRIGLLPPWTEPGTPSERTEAFIRHLRTFFAVPTVVPPGPVPVVAAAPTLPISANDVFAAFVTAYPAHSGGSAFSFADPPDQTAITATAAQVLPDDAAQQWLVRAVVAITALWQVTDIGAGDLHFSLVEALYARGFTDTDQIASLSPADFQFALDGSVAYPWAAAIYSAAGGTGGPGTSPPESFNPVNPDGSLVDCVPPPELDPLGPVAYLSQLLDVTPRSTCDEPLDPGAADSLGRQLAVRRGPLPNLHTTQANLLTSLPVIDLVNESLESLVTTVPGDTAGAIYDTSSDATVARLRAVPEHSSPATPVAQPGAYELLRADFSVPAMPYSQPLDVNRSYLDALRTTRFATMRLFRRDITEFAIDASAEPADFRRHQWRYPVRLSVALEYLHIAPEEYTELYSGAPSQPVWSWYGFTSDPVDNVSWTQIVLQVPEFLARTGLTYCEFLELSRCGLVPITRAPVRSQAVAAERGDGESESDGGETGFPECEPCCPDGLVIDLGEGDAVDVPGTLAKLAVFIRLWRAVQHVSCGGLTLDELADVGAVLQLFDVSGAVNPDFVRQLAALLMLRELLCLPLHDDRASAVPSATGADRTQLLALWVGPSAAAWSWAVRVLVEHVQSTAERADRRLRHQPELSKLLVDNLDPLSVLAGFDPTTPTDTWHAKPAGTLRLAEVLLKIYRSAFTVGEVLYLFSNNHLDGDDPFRVPTGNEADDDSLELPDDDERFGLWALRTRLLAIDDEGDPGDRHDDPAGCWTWARISGVLAHEFGYVAAPGNDPLTELGTHFFADVLEREGWSVTPSQRRFETPLAAADTNAAMWNTPPGGPFRYDVSSEILSTRLPLTDRDVDEKLSSIRALTPVEQAAVQSLYFAPRTLLARFGFLLADFAVAADRLIESGPEDDHARFDYFAAAFDRFYRRCRAICEHIADHVCASAEQSSHDVRAEDVWRLLRAMHGDENPGLTAWEDDSGAPPALTWPDQLSGSAFAALFGVLGTGLVAEFAVAGTDPAWRDMSGPLTWFGDGRDAWNAPVTTVIPTMTLSLTDGPAQVAAVRNGFALRDVDGQSLHGAQPFTVRWSGTLLVERSGRYEFAAGGPTAEGEEPDPEGCIEHHWQVSVRRGQRSWALLNRDLPGEPAPDFRSGAIELRRGCYELAITLEHTQPDFAVAADTQPRHTGFQLKYVGPDTDGELVTVPHTRLFRAEVDAALDTGLQLADGPAGYLRARYTGSLRDVRRTYQRAFKAALVAHRFRLSARPLTGDPESELSYLLDHPQTFSGQSYYGSAPTTFATHQAWFDLDLLPVDDPYRPPSADDRAAPSTKRQAAWFDIWERLFDYTELRSWTRAAHDRPAWRLFYEASERQPDDPAELVRHLGIDVAHAPLVLTYFDLPGDYSIGSPDLESEAWAIRAWWAEQWLDARERCFHPRRLTDARPHRWAADDPAGDPDAGNPNLTAFVIAGALDNSEPHRFADIDSLDDGLRVRARDALVAWLGAKERVPLPFAPGTFAKGADDLSDLLLQDVASGPVERASRIGDAISAAQAFVQRARLGLEPSFVAPPGFADMWDERFATFYDWKCGEQRTLYRENWIEWDELRRARRGDAFRFLEDRLRRRQLTVAVPGSLEWWPGNRPPMHPSLIPVQEAERSQLTLLTPGPLPEGLDLLSTPDRDARPAWLAPIDQPTVTIPVRGEVPPDADNDVAAPVDGDAPAAVVVRSRQSPPDPPLDRLPLWLQAAVRLGWRYVRVAAAGLPPAAAGFRPGDDNADCCCTCGAKHDALVDEYYFWLHDGEEFADIVQDADIGTTDTDETSDWHRPEKLPGLLHIDTTPVVYLYWSRVRHGEFETVRRSRDAVVIDPTSLAPGTRPQLDFVGRFVDSLRFTVSGNAAPVGYGDPTPVGFRYDLVTDAARALPLIAAPPSTPPGSFPGGLDAYPYFAYVCPGAPVEPLSLFAVAETVAGALRADCRFEAALKWYELAYAPLAADNSWTVCGRLSTGEPAADIIPAAISTAGRRDVPCCPTIAPDDDSARERDVLLRYLETLLDWADALLGRDASESTRRADVVLNVVTRVLGAQPPTVYASAGDDVATLADYEPNPARLNPRLTALYARAIDRTVLIHSGQNLRRRVPAGALPYFGDERAECGCGGAGDCSGDCACGREPYRFQVLADKAATLAAEVRTLGGQLLSAYEKGDTEYLAALRQTQERQLLELTVEVHQNQLRDADWQVQALGKTKEGAQSRLRYYQNLIANGKTAGEVGYETLTAVSMGSRTAGNVSEAIAQSVGGAPDFWFGVAGIAGTPLQFSQLPMGTKLGGGFATAARILNALAEIASSSAALSLTEAGWDRRAADWRQTVDTTSIEVDQIERLILGAQRRRDQARRELDNAQRQVENAAAVQNFLRDKFSSHELYLYLQRETAALYYATFALAKQAAEQAQRSFNYELGHLHRSFVPEDGWSNLHEGMLAGDRLALGVQRMQKAYLDTNCREYELTKHVSLRLNFPLQFLQLQATGSTEIEIPEWMFDVDYPGQYLRRIRNVSLTIPCVVGPYTGVHCRLTLIGSTTRVQPTVLTPAVRCCDDGPATDGCGCAADGGGYEPQRDDPRIARSYVATEAIATSTGQNDAGLFEVNFRDERYLPFEFAGAVSRWRVELPPETNFFDLDTLSDVVMHLNYTAREGGQALAAAATAAARCRLPGDGLRLLDLRRDLPEAWTQLSHERRPEPDGGRRFDLVVSEAMFPFVPLRRVSSIDRVQLLIEAPCAEPGSTHVARFFPGGHRHGDAPCDCERIDVPLVASTEYEGLFYGEVGLNRHLPLDALRGDRDSVLGCVELPRAAGEICDAYVVLGYCADRPRGCGAGTGCPCDTGCQCSHRGAGCGCGGGGHDRT